MRRLIPLALLALCGCSKLIGLDDFEYGPHAVGGSAGIGGSAGSGGSAGDGGSAASAGTGVGANGGSQNGAAGGESGNGGMPGMGGTPGTGGTAGMGGAGASGGLGGGGISGSAGATVGGAAGATAGTGGTGATGGVSGSSGTTGAGGVAGTGGTGSTCDTTKDPQDEPCLVDEAYGVFVSGDGNDTTGDGTRVAPYGTINKALDEAAAAGKRVYACKDHGNYTTPVHYRAEHSGVNAYGLFQCDTWTISDVQLKSNVTPAGVEPALTMQGLTGTTRLKGFRFVTPDATLPGQNSIAAIVESSDGIDMEHVFFDSGKGGAGGNATLTPFIFPDGNSLRGNDADSSSPGTSATFTGCPGGGTTVGGGGGDMSPSSGDSGSPLLGAGEGGDVAEATCSAGLGSGAQGANGADGAAGPGAATVGRLIGNQWVPEPGGAGDPGGIAQGGGGGRGSATGAGGGGAAGGCGGAGGRGGLGGGASIALLALNSTIQLKHYTLQGHGGGDGGSGSLGQAGMLGGIAGAGWLAPAGCPGGDGGKGGGGGPGGGGAGGVAIGVAWRGSEPVRNLGSTSPGSSGKGGAAVGNGNPGVQGYGAISKELPSD